VEAEWLPGYREGEGRPPPPSGSRVISAGFGLHDGCTLQDRERVNMLGTILLVLLVLMLLGALPTWPHSRQWGYYPSSGLGLVAVVVLVLLLMNRI
jgi:hypothetical protein